MEAPMFIQEWVYWMILVFVFFIGVVLGRAYQVMKERDKWRRQK